MIGQRRPLFMLLAALAMMVAIWSYLMFVVPKPMTLDQHVNNVASQLRCPICQGESVADSPAEIAQQMREVIRQQIQEGRSDQEIVQYFESRYGEQNIIWSPPWQGFTLLIWIVPMVLLSIGLLLVFFVIRDWRIATDLAVLDQSGTQINKQGHDDLNADKTPVKASVAEDADLERYRKLLEEELAAEDSVFRRPTTEAM
jgi:cytochrome c-type biogenesis protein CcmH